MPPFFNLQCCYNCVMSYENSLGTKKLMQKVGFVFVSTLTDSWLLPCLPSGTSLTSALSRKYISRVEDYFGVA